MTAGTRISLQGNVGSLLVGVGTLLLVPAVVWMVEPLQPVLWQVPSAVIKDLWTDFFFSRWFYLWFGFVLLLEFLIPAVPGQRFWSRGLRQDVVWTVVRSIVGIGIIIPVVALVLGAVHRTWFSSFTIHLPEGVPWAVRFLVAFLWTDFFLWGLHRMLHAVPICWRFHALHHSQRELSFFTTGRVHPFEDLIVNVVGFVPSILLDCGPDVALAIYWLRTWHARFSHGNIRWNMGPLRHVLVTPQSHRIHHSFREEHFNTNFGLTLSIWDNLFRTQHPDCDEYPESGLSEVAYPAEQVEKRSLLGVFIKQWVHPFLSQPLGTVGEERAVVRKASNSVESESIRQSMLVRSD